MRAVLLTLVFFQSFRTIAQPCSGSFNLQVGFPEGIYNKTNVKTGYGGRINFLCKPAWQIPWLLTGLELGYLFSETSPYSLYNTAHAYRSDYNMHVFSALANFRLDPAKEEAFLKPFADVQIGSNYLTTAVKIEQNTYNGFTNVSKTNAIKPQFALAYGANAGIALRLNESSKCHLEFKTGYFSGSKVRYCSNVLINSDGSATLAADKTRMEMLVVQAGLKFRLN